MTDLIHRSILDPKFDDMLNGFWVRPFHSALGLEMAGAVRVDVKEDDKCYTIHAELPGANKEDIHVEINGKYISISAEVKKESEEKEGEKVIRSERYYGQMSRTFTLAQDVDEATATAKYNDGVLELILPKKGGSVARKLIIS